MTTRYLACCFELLLGRQHLFDPRLGKDFRYVYVICIKFCVPNILLDGCLEGTQIKLRIKNYLFFSFTIENGLKPGDALSSPLLNFALNILLKRYWKLTWDWTWMVPIRYCLCGCCKFNRIWLHNNKKKQRCVIKCLYEFSSKQRKLTTRSRRTSKHGHMHMRINFKIVVEIQNSFVWGKVS